MTFTPEEDARMHKLAMLIIAVFMCCVLIGIQRPRLYECDRCKNAMYVIRGFAGQIRKECDDCGGRVRVTRTFSLIEWHRIRQRGYHIPSEGQEL